MALKISKIFDQTFRQLSTISDKIFLNFGNFWQKFRQLSTISDKIFLNFGNFWQEFRQLSTISDKIFLNFGNFWQEFRQLSTISDKIFLTFCNFWQNLLQFWQFLTKYSSMLTIFENIFHNFWQNFRHNFRINLDDKRTFFAMCWHFAMNFCLLWCKLPFFRVRVFPETSEVIQWWSSVCVFTRNFTIMNCIFIVNFTIDIHWACIQFIPLNDISTGSTRFT